MARHWVRKMGTQTETTAAVLSVNQGIYQNSRVTTGNITLVQKVTVVATVLWGLSDTDDTWSLTLIVDDEEETPLYDEPEIDAAGGSDPQVKGHYIFGRGPVLYTPRRLISVPVEHTLTLRINKEQGGTTSKLRWHAQFLMNVSM